MVKTESIRKLSNFNFQWAQDCESTGKIMKISYARCHVVKFDIIFLGLSRQIFFGVITDN